MIGSPASRGAVASVGGARRACFAAAASVGTVSAAIAASATMTGDPHRRIAAVDCAVVNRFTIPCPGSNACPRLRRSRVKSRFLDQLTANPLLGTIGTSRLILSYTTARAGGRWLAAEMAPLRHAGHTTDG